MHDPASIKNSFDLSVIIPVFDAEQYLSRALQSIYTSSLTSFEVIIVDDYSPGNCQDIIACYPDIKYIKHTYNRGLFAARKTGIEAANGEYIVHLDPDDWVQKDIYYEALKKAQICDLDIVIFGVEECNIEGSTWSSPNNTLSSRNYISGHEILQRILMLPNAWVWHIAVNKLVRRTCAIETLKRLSGVPRVNMFEDLLWSVFLFFDNKYNQKISVLSTLGYRYFRHEKSITLAQNSRAASKRLYDGLIVRNIILKALGNNSSEILPFIDVRLLRTFNGNKKRISFIGEIKTPVKYFKLILNYYTLKCNLKRHSCESLIIKEFDLSKISPTAKVYIFGSGKLAKLIAKKIIKESKQLSGFISTFPTPSPVERIPMFDIDVIKGCNIDDVVIIGSVGSTKAIYDSIKEHSEVVTAVSAYGENEYATP
ncbi:glycosyltransferase family 2 protein [Paraglaciecola sp. 2405UD69-4]|uniref:glycosyltransferase family 2 protein n=1 Tax=Paraglaciecola sp. 2405UD69-4 TaxID=3391836 RepID=UPI0039C92EE7